MEQSSCPYANSCSAGRDIPCILWNLKVHHCAHNSLPLIPILSKMKPVHILPFYFFNSHFRVILPTMFRSSKWSFTFRLPGETPACHMLCPSHPPLPDHPNNLVRSTNCEALHYAIFSILHVLHPLTYFIMLCRNPHTLPWLT